MKKNTKMIVGVVAVAAVGALGYYGYKKYQASQTVAGIRMGALTDGYADYNAHIAAQYWKRQHEMQNERMFLSSMRGY
jgi:uncharacterized membrane protein YebE (DUF533 family)